MKKCKSCGKVTKFMYHFNQGIYCDDHKELGLLIQKNDLDIENLRERVKINEWQSMKHLALPYF